MLWEHAPEEQPGKGPGQLAVISQGCTGKGQEHLQGGAEQAKTGEWGKSFCQNGNKCEMGKTYHGLHLTTARSLESFSKSHLVSKNLHSGIVPLKLLMETQLGEYFFSGENMNHRSQEKGC